MSAALSQTVACTGCGEEWPVEDIAPGGYCPACSPQEPRTRREREAYQEGALQVVQELREKVVNARNELQPGNSEHATGMYDASDEFLAWLEDIEARLAKQGGEG